MLRTYKNHAHGFNEICRNRKYVFVVLVVLISINKYYIMLNNTFTKTLTKT